MWAGPSRSPAPAAWVPRIGFPFAPPLPSPQKVFSSFSHFLAPFPTVLNFVSFIVPWGFISASAESARVQLVSQESGLGEGCEKREGKWESPLRRRKGSVVQWGGRRTPLWGRPALLSLCANKLFPQDKSHALSETSLPLSGTPLVPPHVERAAAQFSQRRSVSAGWTQISGFSSSSPMIVWIRVGPVWFKFP